MPARSWWRNWAAPSFALTSASPRRCGKDHAAYIATWLSVLKGDKRFIFTAASHAQRAADYLRSLQPAAKDAPDAVLSAMASEPAPHPDAVAAAWLD